MAMRDELLHERITSSVIGAFYEVYNTLRYGYLESCYQRALSLELRLRGVAHALEAPIDVWYKGEVVGVYRADLLVEDKVIVELKACRAVEESAFSQMTNYLHATGREVGLLLHFGPEAKFHRIVSTARSARSSDKRDP